MIIDTGQIVEREGTESELLRMLNQRGQMLVPVDEKVMTEKQRRERRVSLADHTSPLGKMRGTARNAPCPCGSGLKWKKCCGLS